MKTPNPTPSVEGVFTDFKERRFALIKALTSDKDKFFKLCDPEQECLCLYGYPDGLWEVKPPSEEQPNDLPEPVIGINVLRDGMQDKQWRLLVAEHSQTWLISLASYFGACFRFGKSERSMLFDLINELPTLSEVVTEKTKPPKHQWEYHKRSWTKSSQKKVRMMLAESKEEGMSEEKREDGGDTIPCSSCGEHDGFDVFWICCDTCDRWFHGMCVSVTPVEAQHIGKYKCPICSLKAKVVWVKL